MLLNCSAGGLSNPGLKELLLCGHTYLKPHPTWIFVDLLNCPRLDPQFLGHLKGGTRFPIRVARTSGQARHTRPRKQSCWDLQNTSSVMTNLRTSVALKFARILAMRRICLLLLVFIGFPSGLWFAEETPVHVVIMHTNDLHGQLLPREGMGGIAEISTIIRSAKPDLIVD